MSPALTVTAKIRQAFSYPSKASSLDLSLLLLHNEPTRPFSHTYKMLGQIGAGAFGTVFRAQSLIAQEMRAVKLVAKTDVKQDFDAVVTEIEAIIRLDHPNIVKFYEFFEETSMICLVTELCDGGDFHTLYKAKCPQDEVRLLFRDVTMAVAYCHSEGIAHRDLKLENSLIIRGPCRRIAKVIDFGLAAIRREDDGDKWLQETLGTKYFVAPEVLEKKVRYGVQCDVWSLGVMVYIVLTNQHPFAEDAPKIAAQHLFRLIKSAALRMEPLRAHEIDEAGCAFIRSLLERDADKRITAEEALDREWLRPPSCDELTFARTMQREESRRLVKRITSFGRATRFEKVLLTLAAHQAKLADVEKMRAAFVSLDTHSDGSLSMDELRCGLRSCGCTSSEEQVQAMFASLDFNRNDRVNYSEWLGATLEPVVIDSEAAMRELFHYFDKDSNGKVSREELRSVLGDAEAADVMLRNDTSRDGLLDWDEFKQVLHKLAQHRQQEEA